jgi:alanine racemase
MREHNRAEVRIDLAAITSNIKHLMKGVDGDFLAVVKADAYGHGLIAVAETAVKAGAKYLGVALLEEAFALRAAGITSPIIAWLTPLNQDFERAVSENIELSIANIESAKAISAAGKSVGKRPVVHIEFDSGMGRGGFTAESFAEFLPLMKTFDLDYRGFWTHFARADEPERGETHQQIAAFDSALNDLKAAGIAPEIIHLSNSAAAIAHNSAHRSMVRLGIAMYGLSPDLTHMGSSEKLGLTPAMSLYSNLTLVKRVPAGTPVGYGAVGVTTEATTLGIVTMGYSDGIPRQTCSAVGVVYAGKRAPIIGRVSMDQFVVDLGPGSNAKAGDEVLVFGSDGYSIDEWAQAAGTINYEIVTRIAPRVPRIYG